MLKSCELTTYTRNLRDQLQVQKHIFQTFNKQYIHMHNRSLLFLFALLICSCYCGSFNATVSCTKCSITCGFSDCYKIQSTLWSSQACGDDNCALTSNLNVKFDRCSYDLLGAACGTGICYYPNNTGCIKTDLTTQLSSLLPSGKWVQSSCGACQTTANCSQCSFSLYQGESKAQEMCIGNSCNGYQTMNVTSSSCTNGKSPLGNPCQYCYEVTNTVANPLGICTNSNPRFSSSTFNIYAMARTLSGNLLKLANFLVLSILLLALA